jgi:lysophospholipase L1-like esterase
MIMKKYIPLFLFALAMALSCTRFDDSAIWEELLNHKERIERLEAECNRLNTNITSLQAILEALQANDYVTDIVKIMEDGVEVGYSITFVKGGTITIYHGTNGDAPKVGIQKASDGQYYWTSDGEWLTNEEGDKIPAAVPSEDGKYITPQFRIAEGVWYISFDGGSTWRQIEHEEEPEPLFLNIDATNADYVILTLADGSQIKLPKYNEARSYWYGKKMVCNGDSIPAGSCLSSVTEAFPYLVAEQLGMSLVNYAIGGTVVAKRSGDYDECYYDPARWEYDKSNGLLDKSKKYLVNTGQNTSRRYQIYKYNGSSWVGGGTSSDKAGRYTLSDRVGEMDDDADVVMIMSGSNDFYYNWNPFGDFEDGKYRNSNYTGSTGSTGTKTEINTDINLIESEGVEFIQYGGPGSETSALKDIHDYFTYDKIPVKANHAVKVPYGRNGWWLDKDMKDISLVNFTNDVKDFTAVAPSNAVYLIVCFKYVEIQPEACAVYQSVESLVPTFGEENLLEVHNVEPIEHCAPTPESSTVDYSYTAYFTYEKIPVTGGRAIKVPYGRNAWWLDKDMKDISLVNFTNGSDDFTHIAPANAAYMTVCFKYAEVQPEDCVVQMSTTAPGGLFADSEGKASNEPNETFCDGLHKMCRTLLNKYKNKDIIILIPIKRVQETHWSCVYPEDTNKYGKTLNDYREALIECCEYYSIPYIDLYTLSGLNPHIDPSLFGDTDGRAVHPNAEGHRKMAAVIVAQMESMKRYNE